MKKNLCKSLTALYSRNITTQENIATPHKHYKFIFLGAGASSSLLLMSLLRHTRIEQESVLFIEPELKNINDKTYCFWAEESDPMLKHLEPLLGKSWPSVSISTVQPTPLHPLRYWQISSIDLYEWFHNTLTKYPWERLQFRADQMQIIGDSAIIQCPNFTASADVVFDSRNPQFKPAVGFQTHLWQSFHGWQINSPTACFDPNNFGMMDFNIPQDNSTQFVYTLPYSPHKALVEVTRFGEEPIPRELAELRIKEFLEQRSIQYTITDTETGCIPMSNADFDTIQHPRVINIGSRAHAIKPSTGYAFRTMYLQAEHIGGSLTNPEIQPVDLQKAKNFKRSNHPRFSFYDSLLLKILDQQPHWGKPIFEQLFRTTPVPTVLQFLDEKSTPWQEFNLLRKLPFAPFLRALFQHPSITQLFRPLLLLLITITLGVLTYLSTVNQTLEMGLIVIGLMAVGIPHGAVDHLLTGNQWQQRIKPSFIIKYLGISLLFAAIWMGFPNFALPLFVIYSAWHFGQADGEIWQLSPLSSGIWGMANLVYILGTHTEESAQIIGQISTYSFPFELPVYSLLPWFIWAIISRRWGMAITLTWITFSAFLPLMTAFGLYFIGQHSINGWNKIKTHLGLGNIQLWKKTLPFHTGAWALMLGFYFFWPLTSEGWGIFFIFIACISLPHSFIMHRLYQKS